MSTEQEQLLINRVLALLNRPHGFLVYGGGEGGEYLAHRIGQFSGRHRADIPTSTTVEDFLVNRTQLSYPGIYGLLSLANETFFMQSQSELVDFLRDRDRLTEVMVGEAESLFQGCELPLFRIHRVNHRLFPNSHSWFFRTPELYKEYAHTLTAIKLRTSVEHVISWCDWYVGTWAVPNNFMPFYSKEAVFEYLQTLGVASVDSVRLKLIIQGLGPKPDSIESVFTRDLADLHREYREWLHPSYARYKKMLANAVMDAPEPRVMLDYRRSIEEPGYLASHFDIADVEGFYSGVRSWHEGNLDLLVAHGFTEFQSLRLS